MVKVLKVVGRIGKMVGAAVGVGGWATGLIDPSLALIIGGVAYFIGDGIVLTGDILDDGQLNSSFKLDNE